MGRGARLREAAWDLALPFLAPFVLRRMTRSYESERIVGRAIFRFWPPTRIGAFE